MGGEYITWFNEEGTKERSIFYKLENLGFARFQRHRDKEGFYKYKWILTEKGKKLVDENESLKKLCKEGIKKVDVIEFYNAVMEILGI